MKALSAFFSGFLFSVGLVISGMTLPENIVGFLDFFGAWKPALAFVMLGATGLYAALYPWVMKRRGPVFSKTFDIPAAARIDLRLIAGAAAFGIGWGIGGFCPGPALVALGTGASQVAVFLTAFVVGVILFHLARQNGVPQTGDTDSCG